MGGSKNTNQFDYWAVADDGGLVHNAFVMRQFDYEGVLVLFEVSTACYARVRQVHNPRRLDWCGTRLPPAMHGNFTIVAWRVRAEISCLGCLVVPLEGLG